MVEIDSDKWPKYIFIATVIIAIVVLNIFYVRNYVSSNNDVITDYTLRDEDMNKTREAAVAGLFYPSDVYQLEQEVEGYLANVGPSLGRRPHILVVPHAGYMYSAKVAAQAYQKLLPFKSEIKNVILLGPAHRVALKGMAVSSASRFKTPLGEVSVNQEITQALLAHQGFAVNDTAHKEEHALEVQLPFLQKTLKNFSIIPVLYGQADAKNIAEVLKPYIERNDTLLVVSADLSHYLDKDTAQKLDSKTAAMVEQGQALDEHQSCGATGINTAMILAHHFGLKPQLLDITNSGNITGDMNSVVGYAAWMFSQQPLEEPKLPPLQQEVENLKFFAKHNKAYILDIVNHALQRAAINKDFEPKRKKYPDVMFDKGASFVTLTKQGELRGCIGSVLPSRALALDLAENTYMAAMEDSRFPPLQADELKDTNFSVSLLTGYERINFSSEEDLLSQIEPNIDGLVIRDGNRQGLFLPSVWQQIPDKKEFISNLKIKAGLSPSYWSKATKIYRFRTVEIKSDEN